MDINVIHLCRRLTSFTDFELKLKVKDFTKREPVKDIRYTLTFVRWLRLLVIILTELSHFIFNMHRVGFQVDENVSLVEI